MYEALRKGATPEQLFEKTKIKTWFIEQMKELVELEEQILAYKGKSLPVELLMQAKKDGFADKYLAKLLDTSENPSGTAQKIEYHRRLASGAGLWCGKRRLLLLDLHRC